jgi:hypothetical protein
MNYATYYYPSTYAWRFSQSRSGQPAASVRSISGGNAAQLPNLTIVEHLDRADRAGRTRRPPREKAMHASNLALP